MPIALAAHCCGPLEGSPGAARPNCLNGGSPACCKIAEVDICIHHSYFVTQYANAYDPEPNGGTCHSGQGRYKCVS
ncbi:hypothetical protein Ptr902_09677 [Pyrenophora tritici-repentis]|nr:hypothetical protein Ptr902_09677 [Pyrenophora tritici-repentis]